MGPPVASKAVQCETNSRQKKKKNTSPYSIHPAALITSVRKLQITKFFQTDCTTRVLATTCAAATQPESNVALIATHLLPQLPILTRANMIAALGQKATPHQCVKPNKVKSYTLLTQYSVHCEKLKNNNQIVKVCINKLKMSQN